MMDHNINWEGCVYLDVQFFLHWGIVHFSSQGSIVFWIFDRLACATNLGDNLKQKESSISHEVERT
jgi:hypothetical protein